MAFILDTSTLGGIDSAVTKSIIADLGQGLSLTWTQAGNNQDLEVYGFGVELAPAEMVAFDAQVINTQLLTAYGSGSYSGGGYGASGISGIFILDISTLGSLIVGLDETTFQERGRSMQISWTQAGFDQDLEIFGYGVRFAPAEAEMAPDTA
jgi:hypothetical protein